MTNCLITRRIYDGDALTIWASSKVVLGEVINLKSCEHGDQEGEKNHIMWFLKFTNMDWI
jgi:hypothetical protein